MATYRDPCRVSRVDRSNNTYKRFVTLGDASYVEETPHFRAPKRHAGTIQVQTRPSSKNVLIGYLSLPTYFRGPKRQLIAINLAQTSTCEIFHDGIKYNKVSDFHGWHPHFLGAFCQYCNFASL